MLISSSVAPEHADITIGELHAALRGQAIETRYQPIVDVTTGRAVGLEVLARLNHPARGTLAPDLFIPQIEGAGLSLQLLDAVARRGLTDLSCPALADCRLTIAINLPLDLVLLPEAVQLMEAERKCAGIPAERVIIELTESHPVVDVPTLGRALEIWRAAGYGFSIDDVGPEVLNHRALLELPFTAVKLDKEIVGDAARSDGAKYFMSGIIDSAHRNGLTVIAEGVEDVEGWDRIKRFGSDQAQGYLIARPLPAAALPVWLKFWADQSGMITRPRG